MFWWRHIKYVISLYVYHSRKITEAAFKFDGLDLNINFTSGKASDFWTTSLIIFYNKSLKAECGAEMLNIISSQCQNQREVRTRDIWRNFTKIFPLGKGCMICVRKEIQCRAKGKTACAFCTSLKNAEKLCNVGKTEGGIPVSVSTPIHSGDDSDKGRTLAFWDAIVSERDFRSAWKAAVNLQAQKIINRVFEACAHCMAVNNLQPRKTNAKPAKSAFQLASGMRWSRARHSSKRFKRLTLKVLRTEYWSLIGYG